MIDVVCHCVLFVLKRSFEFPFLHFIWLHRLGSVSDITLAGAVSVGTHGTGQLYGALHTFVSFFYFSILYRCLWVLLFFITLVTDNANLVISRPLSLLNSWDIFLLFAANDFYLYTWGRKLRSLQHLEWEFWAKIGPSKKETTSRFKFISTNGTICELL
jgi:hypothetical protein